MALISYFSSGIPLVRDFGNELAYKNGFAWSRTLTILDPNQDFTGGIGQLILYAEPGLAPLANALQPTVTNVSAQAGSIALKLSIAAIVLPSPSVWFELAARNAAGTFLPYIVGYLKVIL